VEIRCGQHACEAALDTARKRFLPIEAPLLPLPNCDRRMQCECRYCHYDDRRSAARRTTDGAMPTKATPTPYDRREINDRREQDRSDLSEREDEPPSVLDDTYFDYVSKIKD
jgi:hypothetical protein